MSTPRLPAASHGVGSRSHDGRWLWLALLVGLAFAAGGIGTLLQGGDVAGRYLALERPA